MTITALRARVESLEADLANSRALCMEEAARCAENVTFPEPANMVEQAIVAGGKKTAENIAVAIRALIPSASAPTQTDESGSTPPPQPS